MPEIDVNDWLKNTEYTSGYERGDQVIQVKIFVWLVFCFLFFLDNVDYLIKKMWICCCHSVCVCGSLFWLKFVEVFLILYFYITLIMYEFGTKNSTI